MLPDSGNSLHTVHTSCQLTLQHHNSYNRTDNYRQWNAVGSDDGHKDAWNMLKYYWLPINHYLLHLVGLTFTYLSKMHGHSNIKFTVYIHKCTAKYCVKYCEVWDHITSKEWKLCKSLCSCIFIFKLKHVACTVKNKWFCFISKWMFCWTMCLWMKEPNRFMITPHVYARIIRSTACNIWDTLLV